MKNEGFLARMFRFFGGTSTEPRPAPIFRRYHLLVAFLLGATVTLGIQSAFKPRPPAPLAVAPGPAQQAAPAPPVKRHNYDMRDGVDYGYTSLISEEQRRAGQVASSVVVFNYAGSRNGRHQVHTRKGNVIFAAECADPCEYVKVMSVLDADEMRQSVEVETLKNTYGMIAGMALQDAIRGELQPYAEYQGAERYELWVDAFKGLTRMRVKSKP